MPINIESGRSVYCEKPVLIREELPLYKVARGLVKKYSPSPAIVLDLGCSDLVASRELADDGYQVIGLDLAMPALKKAKDRSLSAGLAVADLNHLPLGRMSAPTVLMLDVLEHLKQHEAQVLLERLRDINDEEFVGIVSLPIISPYSIPCWRERIKMGIKRERPGMGLYDSTHQWFSDRKGHREFFKRAGYSVTESLYTTPFGKVVGCLDDSVNISCFGPGSLQARVFKKLVGGMSTIVHPFDEKKRAQTLEALEAYQGIYVIAPQQSRGIYSEEAGL